MEDIAKTNKTECVFKNEPPMVFFVSFFTLYEYWRWSAGHWSMYEIRKLLTKWIRHLEAEALSTTKKILIMRKNPKGWRKPAMNIKWAFVDTSECKHEFNYSLHIAPGNESSL